MLRSWHASPAGGSPRHVYTVTDDGSAKLSEWMSAVDEERACLERVLKRYDSLLGGGGGDTGVTGVATG